MAVKFFRFVLAEGKLVYIPDHQIKSVRPMSWAKDFSEGAYVELVGEEDGLQVEDRDSVQALLMAIDNSVRDLGSSS